MHEEHARLEYKKRTRGYSRVLIARIESGQVFKEERERVRGLDAACKAWEKLLSARAKSLAERGAQIAAA